MSDQSGFAEPAGDWKSERNELFTEPNQEFLMALANAEILLRYAAESSQPLDRSTSGSRSGGRPLRREVIDAILDARASSKKNTLTKPVVAAFWQAFSELSELTHPVSAESLTACAKRPLRGFQLLVGVLACVVIVGSIFLFMNSATSDEVNSLISGQNASALKVWSDLQYYKAQIQPIGQDGQTSSRPMEAGAVGAGASTKRAYAGATQPDAVTLQRLTPDELFSEIVDFARRSSWLLKTASRLNFWFNPPWMRTDPAPVVFGPGNREGFTHLNVPPSIASVQEIVEEGMYQINIYQTIRNYAQDVYKTNFDFYGGISAYLLPAVYALLGAALYAFRVYSRLIRRKTYLPSAAYSARYFIALIAGIVIGLFNSLIPKSLMLSPLAIAFLVGYAVEAFFSRLDDVILKIKSPENAGRSETSVRASPVVLGVAAE